MPGARRRLRAEGRRIVVRVLRVNMERPRHVPFSFVPPHRLGALPTLPPELQYRL